MIEPKQVIIVGARRKRQGTGIFLAKMLHQQGHRIVGVVGSSTKTTQLAVRELKENADIETRAYENLAVALEKESADCVVIASPYETHLELLKQTGTQCHVFCEKPLFWTAVDKPTMDLQEITAVTTGLVNSFAQHKKILHINTQWIYTLPSFMRLHPQTQLLPANIHSFEMGLSPLSTGVSMLIDSAPHFISLLQACLGTITLRSLTISFTDPNKKSLTLKGLCRHQHGTTEVSLELRQFQTPPRPAWYAINGKRVDRYIKMPEYSLSLSSDKQTISFRDPMEQSLEDFIMKIRSLQINNDLLSNSMHCLHQTITQAT